MNFQLKALRKRAGFKNRQEFVDALGDGYNVRKITSWENSERMPSLEQACDLADFLHCTLDELAGRDYSPPEYSDARQQALNTCYAKLNDRSKGELAGLASTMTADPSRLRDPRVLLKEVRLPLAGNLGRAR